MVCERHGARGFCLWMPTTEPGLGHCTARTALACAVEAVRLAGTRGFRALGFQTILNPNPTGTLKL